MRASAQHLLNIHIPSGVKTTLTTDQVMTFTNTIQSSTKPDEATIQSN